MEHKMNDAIKRNNLDLLIVIGEDKRYKKYGISLSELKNINL